jgi:hypothetical protein
MILLNRVILVIGDWGSGEAAPQDSQGRSPISANLRSLGLYTEDLSRLVRRSLEVAFSISNYCRAKEEGTQ